MHAVMLATQYHGASYPRGGPDIIVQKITATITACGGKVIHNAPVHKILFDTKIRRATCVEMKDGRKIKAKLAVVSDAGVLPTFRDLMDIEDNDRSQLLQDYSINNSNKPVNGEVLPSPSSMLEAGPTGVQLFLLESTSKTTSQQFDNCLTVLFGCTPLPLLLMSMVPKTRVQRTKAWQPPWKEWLPSIFPLACSYEAIESRNGRGKIRQRLQLKF